MKQKLWIAAALLFALGLGLGLGLGFGYLLGTAAVPKAPAEPSAGIEPSLPTPAPTGEPAPAAAPVPTEEPEATEEPEPPEDGPVFPESGYTTGDREVDLWLKEIIDSQSEPDITQEELQRKLYLYVRDSFGYRKSKFYTEADGDFIAEAVAFMMEKNVGNCYNYASLEYALFRAIGLEVQMYVGSVGDGQAHCWITVLRDGVAYVCDAELEMQSIRIRKEPRDFYMQTDTVQSMMKYRVEFMMAPEQPEN